MRIYEFSVVLVVAIDTQSETIAWLEPHDKGIYMLKANSGNTRKICEICSKLSLKTTPRHWRHNH